jgi:hydrogenase expression/formation protein HypE
MTRGKDDSGAGEFHCPMPISRYAEVLMAHGGGGKLTHDLIEKLFLPHFGRPDDGPLHDGALLDLPGGRLAFTTDSYVVQPLIFPGGDIGSLAVNGTVNDLAMCGARPLYLSVGFILEEGLPMETLELVVRSMGEAARAGGVRLVTGDTKVVDRGKGDGIFINTSGVGILDPGRHIGPAEVAADDAVILSGDVGRHGIAIMASREGLAFENRVESDCAPLVEPVFALLEAGVEVHCLRDLTRGGLATVLVEIAEAARLNVQLDEGAVPISNEVRGACELLGLDPLYVANEGRFAAFVAPGDADRAVETLRSCKHSAGAVRVGDVHAEPMGTATLKGRFGVARILDMLSGEQLPRIC